VEYKLYCCHINRQHFRSSSIPFTLTGNNHYLFNTCICKAVEYIYIYCIYIKYWFVFQLRTSFIAYTLLVLLDYYSNHYVFRNQVLVHILSYSPTLCTSTLILTFRQVHTRRQLRSDDRNIKYYL